MTSETEPTAAAPGLTLPMLGRSDYVMVRPEEVKQSGAIFVEQEAPPVGVVVLPEGNAGLRVLYQKYTGTEVVLNGEKMILLPTDQVLLLLAPEDVITT
jgi:hypothetical protein